VLAVRTFRAHNRDACSGSIPRHPEVTIEPEAISNALTQVALDHKGFDVAILDMRNLVDYTDFFVLCSARNRRHVAAVAEALRLEAKKAMEVGCLGVEGLPSARWVLLDFGTVIVHVFEEPMRAFYNLDGLWSDAPRLLVPDSAPSYGGGEPGDDADGPDPDDFDTPTSEIELSG
jgi:ribosome-associated protein